MSMPTWETNERHTFDDGRFQLRIELGSGGSRVEFVAKGASGSPGTTIWTGSYDSFKEWAKLVGYAFKQLETPPKPVPRDIGIYAPGTK